MHDRARNNVDAGHYTEVPEADAAEQAAPVAPEADLELEAIEEAASRSMDGPPEADPADIWEQSLPVLDDEDGYEHD